MKRSPLERQMVKCPECKGAKERLYYVDRNGYSHKAIDVCRTCNGKGKVLEPLEAQVKRLQEIARQLAIRACIEQSIYKRQSINGILDAAFRAVKE